jgi:hypothetical protein
MAVGEKLAERSALLAVAQRAIRVTRYEPVTRDIHIPPYPETLVRPLLLAAVAAAVPLLLNAQSPARNTTYDAVLEGMSCKQRQSGEMDCEYKVGRTLRFLIAGVGQPDVAITFFKTDVDGDYYASFAVLHGCVVVKPTRSTSDTTILAFVSPRDGKTYRNWPACFKPPAGQPAVPPVAAPAATLQGDKKKPTL